MSRFTINGDVGDVFIRITKDRDVQLIFGEDDDSIYREVDWVVLANIQNKPVLKCNHPT